MNNNMKLNLKNKLDTIKKINRIRFSNKIYAIVYIGTGVLGTLYGVRFVCEICELFFSVSFYFQVFFCEIFFI